MKKTVKFITAAVAALALFLSALPAAYADSSGEFSDEPKQYGDFEYCFVNEVVETDGHERPLLTICGINTSAKGKLIIPEKIDGYYVEKIGDCAFMDCRKLTEIVLPSALKRIGSYAFAGCTGITEITLPDGVCIIDGGAFGGCSSLRKITLPDSLTTIGDLAFSGCSGLEVLILPENLKDIGESAFENCSSLRTLTIPENVISIGKYAFWDCSALTEINVDENNQKYTSIDGNLYSKDKTVLIKYAGGKKETSFTVPNGVSEIASSAFGCCTELESVTFPEELEKIGDEAFWGCSSLTRAEIPDDVGTISQGAFKYCTALTNVTLPGCLCEVDAMVFSGCSSLTEIKIPGYVTKINTSAFENCTALENIELSERLKVIEDGAFKNTAIKSVVIPKNVMRISTGAFKQCDSFTDIFVDKNNEYLSDIDGNLYSKDKTKLIRYITGKSGESFAVPQGVTKIGCEALADSTLKHVTLPESLTVIGDSAFENSCITEIDIPAAVTEIGWMAFGDCKNLQHINVDENNENYTSVDGVLYSKNMTTLVQYAAAKNDESFTLPAGVTDICVNAFSKCTNLKCINADEKNENYTSIDGNLYSKDKTELIRYAAGKTEKDFKVPDGVEHFGYGAFWSSALESITIPESYSELIDSTYAECDSLRRVYYYGESDGYGSFMENSIYKNYENIDFIFIKTGSTAATGVKSAKKTENGCSYEFRVDAPEVFDATFTVAAYTEDGKLIGLKQVPLTGKNSYTVSDSLETGTPDAGYRYFLWGGESGLTSLCDAGDLEIDG